MKMTAPQFAVLHNDMLQRIPKKNTCRSTQNAQKRWNLFSLFITEGKRPFCFALLSIIFPIDTAPPHCRLQYCLREEKMGSIQKIFLPNVFIGIFHYIKQLPVCLFHLPPLTCAGTIHSKGKATAHVPFISVTWMFVP